jgi:hypothetical protein
MIGHRALLILVILLFASLDVFAQDDQPLRMDKMIKSVAYLDGEGPKIELLNGLPHEIWIRKPGSNEFHPLTVSTLGTGFFVREAGRLFLVTAAHVARGLVVNVRLITSDALGNSKPYPLDRSVKWVFSEEADVAASLIDDPLLISTFLETAIDLSILPTTETSPVPELSLVVVGFPLGLGVGKKFSPLRRETQAASGLIDLKRADMDKKATFFLLQDPSIGGYSGAPVFVLKTFEFGNTPMKSIDVASCIGLIHGTQSDNTGGKLGLVTPANYVYDLIKSMHSN